MNNIIIRYQKNISRIVNDDKIYNDVAKLFKFLKVARDKKKNAAYFITKKQKKYSFLP